MNIRSLFNLTLNGLSRFKNYDREETICLLGTSRGGTTLLAQIVNQIPKTQVLWEPLMPNNNRECERAGFGWHHILNESDIAVSEKAYIQSLLSGGNIHWGTLRKDLFKVHQFLLSERLIIKFVNANRILSWLSANFTSPFILMTRSPFAVVASKKNHGGFRHVTKRNWLPERLVSEFSAIQSIYDRINTIEEVLVWDWCVDTFLALQNISDSVFVLTYEELICSPDNTLLKLFQFLGLPIPPQALKTLRLPSLAASDGVHAKEPANQIVRYKERLNTKEIVNIRRVVAEFGLTFYLENDMPTGEDVCLSDELKPLRQKHSRADSMTARQPTPIS